MAMSCNSAKGKTTQPKIITIETPEKDCSNAKEKTSQPKIITLETPEKGTIGKPCIDFQPDDRWQIKEDDVPNKGVTNSKTEVRSNTNGRRSLRRSSTRSKDSAPALNGEAANSCSDEDSNSKNAKQDKVVENLEVKNQTRSKRRLSSAKLEPEVSNPESGAAKKMRVENNNDEHSENCHDDKEVNHDGESNNKSVEDSSDKNAMPNLSPAASESKESVKNEPAVESSEETTDSTNAEMESEKDKNGENDTDVLPKLEEFKKSDVTCIDIEDSKDAKETKSDPDIEIINVDTKKSDSDCESDSEVQIIGAEESANKPAVNDFITDTPPEGDMSLSAGYPYYNSLKEKISNFKAGEYKPVKFPHTGTLLLGEHEVIIESPSLLVPLLIKENDEFPNLEKEEKKTNGEESTVMRPNMISKRNFFQSSVGQFLINLGMSRVQEWYQRDMKHLKMKQLKSTLDKDEELEKVLENHKERYDKLREVNSPFTFRMKRCKFCNFKSESLAVLEDHYLTPHLTPRREYRCNFCSFLTRDLEGIMFHYEAMHAKKANILNNIPFHECTFCSFQHHLKTKVNAHMNRCRKHFIPSQNLAPPFDFEFPGVTTKPVTINDVIGHRRLLLSSAKNQRLPMPDDNNPNSAYARKKLASVLNKITGQNAYPDIKNPNLIKQLMGSQSQMPALSTPSIQLPPGIVITRPRGPTLQPIRPVGNRYPQPRVLTGLRAPPPRRGPPYTTNISSTASQLASSGISITPVTRPGTSSPRPSTLSGTKNVTLTPISTVSNRTVSQKPGPPQPVALFTNMAGSGNMMGQPQARLPVNINLRPLRPTPPYQRLNTPPSQVVKGSSGNTFVMCEICDSYIKDLEELRTHMNWVHKVKIHPKMLVSRPPLNCQKCQWRFFTDQGLERHLLGAHGLVTTNMQEMANKNQDGGRCIICGAVFTYKLVSHMTQVHKVTLKPAHLSYKCTVCTATFTLYRLFESHVYNVHSGSAKRAAEDAASSEPPSKKSSPDDSGPRKCRECGLVTENMQDHLIKMHIRKCAVKLCRIEKCEKCLYSSDEMLVIRMSDFGLDEDVDDSGDDSSEEDDSENSNSDAEEKPKCELVEDTSDAKSDSETTSKTGEQVKVESEAESKDIKEEPDSK